MNREKLVATIAEAIVDASLRSNTHPSMGIAGAQAEAALAVAEAKFKKREAALKATIDHMRAYAYAAVNPANWQKPEKSTDAHRLAHYQQTLDGIADGGEHFGVVEALHSHYMKREAEIRADEREACAALCESEHVIVSARYEIDDTIGQFASARAVLGHAATSIRERAKTSS